MTSTIEQITGDFQQHYDWPAGVVLACLAPLWLPCLVSVLLCFGIANLIQRLADSLRTKKRRPRYRMAGTIASCAAVTLLSSGCTTSLERIARMEQQLLQYQVYANQARTYDAVAISGTNLSWSVSGATEIRMQAPLNAISPPDRDPTAAELAAQVVSGGIPWVAGAIVGHAAMRRAGGTTTIQEQPPAAEDAVAPAPIRTRGRVRPVLPAE